MSFSLKTLLLCEPQNTSLERIEIQEQRKDDVIKIKRQMPS